RRRAIEAQLPDALSVVAGSLSAGHTFLRSLQLLCEEAGGPLGEELARVVRETQLGTPVVDALSAMADRVDVPDVRWVVQAIRVQQEVGGKLADLLYTLADFMRARDEVRREVRVLTAEGRLSAWVLGALPVVLVLAIRVLNPGYLSPLLHGWGLAVLLGAAGSVAVGVLIIRRLVRIEV
ncbi:MAG TPA: type II secretion system F family protein, partial [Acidimicrobiales bacterium]|nr:type II secretion system F family protein [Acidimicrobiales bacterium]